MFNNLIDNDNDLCGNGCHGQKRQRIPLTAKRKLLIASIILAVAALALWNARRLRSRNTAAADSSGSLPATTEPATSGSTTAPAATTPSTSAATRPESSEAILFPFNGPIQGNGLPSPWEARVIVGKLEAEVVKDASGNNWLRIKCDKSHVVAWCKTTPIDPVTFPIIAWQWKATSLPLKGDSRTHTALPMVGDYRNDKGLQLMVGFEGDLVLNYVWDSNAPASYEFDERSPVATIKTQVIDSGPPTPGNREHRVDVRADFVRRFGKPPGKILGVGISANTNHTASTSDGSVGAIRLLPANSR